MWDKQFQRWKMWKRILNQSKNCLPVNCLFSRCCWTEIIYIFIYIIYLFVFSCVFFSVCTLNRSVFFVFSVPFYRLRSAPYSSHWPSSFSALRSIQASETRSSRFLRQPGKYKLFKDAIAWYYIKNIQDRCNLELIMIPSSIQFSVFLSEVDVQFP